MQCMTFLIVYFLLKLTLGNNICDQCICSAVTVDCTSSNFSSIKENILLSENTTEAYLIGLRLPEVYSGMITGTKLELLDLSANVIQEIPGNAFDATEALTRLNLRNNLICTLKNNSFRALRDLAVLDLSFNKIKHLPLDLLSELSNLYELSFKYNPIEDIPEKLFINSMNLKHLDLSHLQLKYLRKIFHWDISLETLDLSHNLLKSVPTEALSALSKSLKVLKLSGNHLKVIRSGSFYGLAKLREIEMKQVLELQKIESYAFSGLESLESLELKYLPVISVFDEKAFHISNISDTKCPIYDLTICFTTLPTLPQNLLNWSKLRLLELKDNNWNCDCKMKWIKGSLVEKMVGNDLHCRYPYKFSSYSVTILDEDDFICTANDYLISSKQVYFIVFIFALGLVISAGTVMYLSYKQTGGICRKPRGFELLENERNSITIFDRTDSQMDRNPYQTTVQIRDS